MEDGTLWSALGGVFSLYLGISFCGLFELIGDYTKEICKPTSSLVDASILYTALEGDDDKSPEFVIIPPRNNTTNFAYHNLRVFLYT